MRFIHWLLSNWFILLTVGIAIISVYLAYLTYRMLYQVGSAKEPNTASAESDNSKRYRYLSRIRPLLAFVFFVLIVSSLIFSVLKNATRPDHHNDPVLTADIAGPASYGDDLLITLDKTTLVGDSSYTISVTIRYKTGESTKFSDLKEGTIINFPPENGYDIKIVAADDHSASFLIKKS